MRSTRASPPSSSPPAAAAACGGSARRRRLRALGLQRLGRLGELERERAVLAVEQGEARCDEIDALRGNAPAQQRLAAERDGRRRGQRQRHVAGIGDAHVLQLELELPGVAQAQHHPFDAHLEARDFLGDGSLDWVDEKVQRHRTVQQPHVDEAAHQHDCEGGDADDLGQQRQGDTPAGARGGGPLARRAGCGERTSAHPSWARQTSPRRTPACSVSPLAPRSWSHRSLARMAIPSHRPAPRAGRQTTKLMRPVQLPARPRARARRPPRRMGSAIPGHLLQRRISHGASQGAPRPPVQGKEAGKATKRRRCRLGAAAEARRRRPRQRGRWPPAARSVRSAAAAPGRRCRAPDAAGASCRRPARRDPRDPWSPRRRPRARSSRRATGHALPRR